MHLHYEHFSRSHFAAKADNFLANHFSDIRIKWKLQDSRFFFLPFLTQEILDTRHVFSFNAKLIAPYLIGLFATYLHISLLLSPSFNWWPSVPYWTSRFLTWEIYCCLPSNGNENIVEINIEHIRYRKLKCEIYMNF